MIWARNYMPVLALSLTTCSPGSGLSFTTATPPIALVPASAVVERDERGAFRAAFCSIMTSHGKQLTHARSCDQALHRLAGERDVAPRAVPGRRAFETVRLVIVPGIFGECVAHRVLPFQDAESHLREGHGLRGIEWIRVSGRSSSAANARVIADWLVNNPTPPGRRLVLLGYSKGATDLIEMLGRFPGAVPAGTAIVGVAPVVSGTPIADRGASLYSALARLPLRGCKPGDEGGVRSLTRRERLAWLAEHPLPATVRFYVLPAFARRSEISRALVPFHSRLSSHDERNDGQVLFQDAVIPGARILGYANADHWAVTLPLRERLPEFAALLNHNAYPRTVMLEAILQTVAEE